MTDEVGFMFNTNFTSNNAVGAFQVMDAAATFNFSDTSHIWAGRFLAPSSRSNLYGAFYQNSWAFLSDGVQDPYPQHTFGRDEGVMYWGQFGITKFAAGIFNNFTGANAPLTDGGDLKGAAPPAAGPCGIRKAATISTAATMAARICWHSASRVSSLVVTASCPWMPCWRKRWGVAAS